MNMDRRNTTIWRGGLSELLASDEPLDQPPAVDSSSAHAAAGPHQPIAQPNAARYPLQAASSGTLIMRHGLPAASRSHDVRGAAGTATRVLPIERLLKPPAAPTAQSDGAIAPARPIGMREVRVAIMLACFGGLIALLYYQPVEQAEQPPQAAEAPVLHPSRVTAPAAVAAAVQPLGAAPVDQARGPSPQLARAAVDALASGDARHAARLYEELAAARPGQPVYAIAARTLQARVTGR
jgi:hypothetical protein